MPWVKLQVKNNVSEFLILLLWKYMKCLLYLEILMLKWPVIFVTYKHNIQIKLFLIRISLDHVPHLELSKFLQSQIYVPNGKEFS